MAKVLRDDIQVGSSDAAVSRNYQHRLSAANDGRHFVPVAKQTRLELLRDILGIAGRVVAEVLLNLIAIALDLLDRAPSSGAGLSHGVEFRVVAQLHAEPAGRAARRDARAHCHQPRGR